MIRRLQEMTIGIGLYPTIKNTRNRLAACNRVFRAPPLSTHPAVRRDYQPTDFMDGTNPKNREFDSSTHQYATDGVP
jgi:hypothetical protein